jgi:hypothetical protein
MRVCYEQVLRFFEYGNNLLTTDTGKVLEEFIEGVPALEIIDEVLKWDASAGEHRSSAENLGVTMHDFVAAHRLILLRRAGRGPTRLSR